MKILVIQTAFIGDVVLTTPFLAELRRRFPGSEIHFVATPQGCEMLRGLDGVTCHVLEKKKAGALRSLRNVLAELGSGAPFDFVFSVHRSLRSLAIARKVRAKRKIAFRSFWSKVFGFESVRYPSYDEKMHYSDKPLALLSAVGPLNPIASSRHRPCLTVLPEDRASLRGKLGGIAELGQDYLVLSPFSVWGTKMWFADRFARAAATVARERNLPVVVIGGGVGSEMVTGRTIAEKIGQTGGRALSLVGQTSIGELKALIADAKLVLANDSAPVHVAAAFNIPTVAIFGPTTQKWGFFPLSEKSFVVERRNVSCRPCHLHGPQRCPKGHFRCMSEIQVEDVANAVENLLR